MSNSCFYVFTIRVVSNTYVKYTTAHLEQRGINSRNLSDISLRREVKQILPLPELRESGVVRTHGVVRTQRAFVENRLGWM